MPKLSKRLPRGFTIVELLVVIVVVGILATVTIVVYTGIQQKAREARLSTQLGQIRKEIELYYIENGAYPFESSVRSAMALTTDISDRNWAISNYLNSKSAASGVNGAGYTQYYYDNPSIDSNGRLLWCIGVVARNSTADNEAVYYIGSGSVSVARTCNK